MTTIILCGQVSYADRRLRTQAGFELVIHSEFQSAHQRRGKDLHYLPFVQSEMVQLQQPICWQGDWRPGTFRVVPAGQDDRGLSDRFCRLCRCPAVTKLELARHANPGARRYLAQN